MTVAAITMESRLTAVEIRSTEDHKLLHGNGQPGLESRVNTLEAEKKRYDGEIKAIKDEQDELDGKLDKITISIATIQSELSELKKSVDRIYEKNRWYKELIRALGWIVSLGFMAYEAFFK